MTNASVILEGVDIRSTTIGFSASRAGAAVAVDVHGQRLNISHGPSALARDNGVHRGHGVEQMRGEISPQDAFSYVSPKRRVPAADPLRRIKADADEALCAIIGELDEPYRGTGRPSIAPERLLKGQLLSALFSVRSDRAFCEQLDYNLLYRWFLDMSQDESGLDQSNFSRLRERQLLSSEHFTVDSTLMRVATVGSWMREWVSYAC